MRDWTRKCVHAVSIATVGLALGLLGGCTEAVRPPTPLERELSLNASPENIAAHLHAHRGDFATCHQVYGPRLTGMLVMRFKIRDDGTPMVAHVLEDIGQSSRFDRCLVDALNRLNFGPLPPRTLADVTFPLVFGDAQRAPAFSPGR